MEPMNMMAVAKQRTWFDRFIRFTVFSGYPSWPWKRDGDQTSYGVSSEVHMVFDWKDRLRVLIGGVVVVKICVDTLEDVRALDTRTAVAVVTPQVKRHLRMDSPQVNQ